MDDKGAILLLDERFQQNQYVSLFPLEWFPNLIVNQETMQQEINQFWKRVETL
jgi:Rad3-related DNA helicase